MSRAGSIEVPPPHQGLLEDGIDHPDLWLWDAWTYEREGTLVLFTLAIARTDARGVPTSPATRNDYPFHVREFRSEDGGRSWRDHGAYLSPGEGAGGAARHNVWSGGALVDRVGGRDRLLFSFTGVRRPGPGRSFLQSICLVEVDPLGPPPDLSGATLLCDPERDREAIVRTGYYLGPEGRLGADEGEEGGPLLAWRDPFLVPEGDGAFRAYWSGKVDPAVPAVVQARLRRTGGSVVLDALLPPIELPDADAYTQAEVPKVYAAEGGFLMLISACDRLREDQPDDEVTKALRLYRSDALDGPWTPYAEHGSLVLGTEHLFGGSLVRVRADAATLIAPYTEMAPAARQLTFAPPQELDLRAR